MSAIEELHRMLDERGVEYEETYGITLWTGADGCAYTAIEMVPLSMKPSKKLMVRRILTPEQAIEATLGRGTCTADETDTWECVRDDLGNYGKTMNVHVMECTECGHTYEHVNGDYEYCPRCGRKRRDFVE